MTDGMLVSIIERANVLIPNAQESLIEVLAEQCADDMRLICGLNELPEGAVGVLVRMVEYHYTRIGAAGLQSQSHSGMSESYMPDYPEPLKREMYRFRRIRSL